MGLGYRADRRRRRGQTISAGWGPSVHLSSAYDLARKARIPFPVSILLLAHRLVHALMDHPVFEKYLDRQGN